MITVLGEHAGHEVVRVVLAHGADPAAELASRGWAARSVVAEGVAGALVLRYAVERAPAATRPAAPQGPGLDPADASAVVPRQRVAAYAVVVADGAVLLTQLATRTGAGGRWNLPGGGLEPGEEPAAAVVREVAEETGQVVDRVRLVGVMTQHWVGRSWRGVEDHHAVRLLHVARCTRPTRPVVHDVGGSTTAARWVPLDELGSLPVVQSVPVALEATGTRWVHRWPQS